MCEIALKTIMIVLNTAVLVTLMFLCSTMSAQEFAQVGSKWTYQNYGSSGLGFPVAFQFRTDKDTLINDRSCAIITKYALFESGVWEKRSSEVVASSESGDTVYVYFQDSFHILFDFTAEVGDTIEVTDSKFDGFFVEANVQQNRFVYKIDSIVSTPYGLDTLLVQYVSYLSPPVDTFPEWGFGDITDLSNNTPGRIVKGVGALNRIGILGTSTDFSFFFDSTPDYLTCYEDNTKHYKFSDVDCDSLVSFYTAVDDLVRNKNSYISISPNPFTESITIRNDNIEVNYFQIYDISGHLIKTFKPGLTSTINLSWLPSGVYIISLSFRNGKLKTYRIIKQ